MLRGEDGFQAKEVAQAAATGCAGAAALRRRHAPERAAAGPGARAAPRAAGRPRRLHAAGRGPVPGGARTSRTAPSRWRSSAASRPRWTRFMAMSDYYAGLHGGLPRPAAGARPHGAARHQPRRPRGSARRPAAGPFTVGYFARMAPEKGLHLLADAYSRLRRSTGSPARALEVAGYLAPEHRAYLAQVEADARGRRARATSSATRASSTATAKIAFLRGLDVLSVPSPYVEPKGLYLLEAMANGVPVVQPRHGAFPEILEKTGGGLLFEPGNADDLAARPGELVRDPARGRAPGRRGAAGVRRHYGRPRMADAMDARATASADTTARRMADGLVATDVRKEYASPRGPLAILDGVSLDARARRVALRHGPVGQRQEHAALHPGRAGAADLRAASPSAGDDPARCPRRRWPPSATARRLRLPGPLPAAAVHRARERAGADAGRAARRDARRRGRASCWRRWASASGSTTGRRSSRAARSSAWPSPARWCCSRALLLCDEPTGNLDARAADAVGALLLDLHRRQQTVLVLVTHSAELAARFADRRLLRAGRLVAAA